jgi:hypothetical protein
MKQFTVAAVSLNTNSFGLVEHVLVARDGTTFRALKTHQFKHAVDDVLDVPTDENDRPIFARLSFECPVEYLKCPPQVVEELWARV